MERTKWQCNYCGQFMYLGKGFRPNPGECSRRPVRKDGKKQPHVWRRC